MGGSLSCPQSPLIGVCSTFAPRFLHCRPTPLTRRDNMLARLIPITRQPRVHHLEAITCTGTFSLRACPCLDTPTLFSTQVICVPYVRWEPISHGTSRKGVVP
ncbi:hypothetical protein TNCV_2235081 [Trichonephila clavipes]|nr:hypothetical protein TNCV_2235081 [Trichonephila clavipes]